MKNDNFEYLVVTDQKSGKKSVVITGLAKDKQSTMAKVVIPSEIDGIPVTKIGDRAFFGNSKITSVYMPDSVVEIGKRVFERCSELTSITFSKNLKKMGDCCLCDCKSLNSVDLPDTVEHMGFATLAGTGIKTFSIPPLIKKINNSLFQGCESLVSIIAKGKLESVGESACYGCSSLESFPFQRTIEEYKNYAFVESGIKEAVIGKKTKLLGDHLFYNCSNLTSLKLNIDTSKRGLFGYNIVEGCRNLENISGPDGLKYYFADGFKKYIQNSNTGSAKINITYRKSNGHLETETISDDSGDLARCVLTSNNKLDNKPNNKSDNKKHKMHL